MFAICCCYFYYYLVLVATTAIVEANPTASSASSSSFLDVYLRVQPVDDFCGARQCNITYALSVLAAQNQFDLQSLMLQDGSMTRNRGVDQRNDKYFFEDNTVIRLTKELHDVGGKLYLGVMLFDVPDDIQDYMVVEVTDVVHRDRRARMEFASETVRIQVHVYKRNEALLSNDLNERLEAGSAELEGNALSRKSNHRHNHHRDSAAAVGSSVLSSPYSTAIARNNKNGSDTNEECVCASHNCGCCQHVTIRKIHLDDTACVNVSYISEDIGLRLTLSVDNHIYYSKELSVRNPPPACFEVPHLRAYASLCMRLYNVSVSEKSISGCTEIEAKLYHIKVAREKLGCFRIPL